LRPKNFELASNITLKVGRLISAVLTKSPVKFRYMGDGKSHPKKLGET